jgi:hypothetical protein
MSELVCKTLELLAETKGSFVSAVKNIFDTKSMATLKISDLSVGDWVNVMTEKLTSLVCCEEIEITRGYIHSKIKGIREEGFIAVETADSRYTLVDIGCIGPIPITTEILEKNGFVRGNRGDFYHYHRLDKNRTLYIHASTNGWRVEITYDAAGILRTTHLIPDMNSVHDLQHALRLAGLYKEITL